MRIFLLSTLVACMFSGVLACGCGADHAVVTSATYKNSNCTDMVSHNTEFIKLDTCNLHSMYTCTNNTITISSFDDPHCKGDAINTFVAKVNECDTSEHMRVLDLSCNTSTPTLITANGTMIKNYETGMQITKFLYSHSGASSVLAVVFFMICMGQLAAIAYIVASKQRNNYQHHTIAVSMEEMEMQVESDEETL